MLQHLRCKKKFIHDKRAFSSIAGAIFAVIIILSLMSTVFVWSLTQNTSYNNVVKDSTQADLNRLNEKVVANLNCLRVNDSHVLVNGVLANNGALTANVTTLWVTNSNKSTSCFIGNLNIVLPPGKVIDLNGYTARMDNSLGDALKCWFVTDRGNIITLNSGATNLNQTIYNIGGNSNTYSNVTQGIGLIAYDFKRFGSKDFVLNLPTNHSLLGNIDLQNFILHQDHYYLFRVTLTCYDYSQQPMILNGTHSADYTSGSGSSIYLLAGQGQTVKFGFYYLVSVTNENGNLYINKDVSNAQYTLEYGKPVDVYFLGKPGIASLNPGVYPLNIMVFGKLAGQDYGQNVPFVSINVLT